jgi:NADPH:quinone reductase-like Zn-dependent oxidoreductase
MKQIWIEKPGAPETLRLREADDPVAGPGEIVIDVKASGVNFADVMARLGIYPDAPPRPCVVGYEVTGVVRECGPDTDTFSPGDRVVALTRFGGYSTVVSVPQVQVYALPEALSFAEGAAIPVQYFTAYLALHRFGNVQSGERVLVHNAGGGVGIAATQLAKHAGAVVYGTASSWKHEKLAELGADELIDYRQTDWVHEVQSRTDGHGVHVIIDPLGGKNLKRDLEILAPLGRLIAFGSSSAIRGGTGNWLSLIRSALQMPRPGFLKLLGNNWSIAGLNLGHLWSELERLRAVGDDVLRGAVEGWIKPVIAAEVPFDTPADAHQMLQDRKNLGKVVLVT